MSDGSAGNASKRILKEQSNSFKSEFSLELSFRKFPENPLCPSKPRKLSNFSKKLEHSFNWVPLPQKPNAKAISRKTSHKQLSPEDEPVGKVLGELEQNSGGEVSESSVEEFAGF